MKDAERTSAPTITVKGVEFHCYYVSIAPRYRTTEWRSTDGRITARQNARLTSYYVRVDNKFLQTKFRSLERGLAAAVKEASK